MLQHSEGHKKSLSLSAGISIISRKIKMKALSYFEQLEQVFLVEAGGREAGMVYPVRHSVEQKSWVEPFLW